jgi:hypothetical protein
MNAFLINPTDAISRALVREQKLFALKTALRNANSNLPIEQSRAVSDEDRLGAALLRIIIERMDVFMVDADATLFRLVVPNDLVSQLEVWGASTSDYETDHDLEYQEPLELSA